MTHEWPTPPDGVFYSFEDVERAVRVVAELRGLELAAGRFDTAVALSHVVAMLRDYALLIDRVT